MKPSTLLLLATPAIAHWPFEEVNGVQHCVPHTFYCQSDIPKDYWVGLPSKEQKQYQNDDTAVYWCKPWDGKPTIFYINSCSSHDKVVRDLLGIAQKMTCDTKSSSGKHYICGLAAE